MQSCRDRRTGQSDPIDGAVHDPLDNCVGQGLGIGVVIDRHLVDNGRLPQYLLEERTASIGSREQDFAASGSLPEGLGERFRAIGVGYEVSLQVKLRQCVRRRRTNGGELQMSECPEIAALLLETPEEEPDSRGRRENQPVIFGNALDGGIERPRIGNRP